MIDWTEGAVQQLDWAREYITVSNSEEIARRVVDRILSSVEQLARFPMLGRPRRIPDKRELVISKTPFIASYTVQKTRIVVLAIYHGAQRWPQEW
jgi:plasmid stabilization system protein ParE